MRVFTVSQSFDKATAESTKIRRSVVKFAHKPIGDGSIIRGGSGKSLGGEPSAQPVGRHSPMDGQLGDQARVVFGFHDDGNVGVVLGSRPDHGGTADIDVLDAIAEARALSHGRLEWV